MAQEQTEEPVDIDLEDIYTAGDERPKPSAPLDIGKLIIKLDWTGPFPERWRARLQIALQTCLCRLEENASVHSVKPMDDKSCAEVQITPSAAVESLKKLKSIHLKFKNENKEVTAWICQDEADVRQKSMLEENGAPSLKLNTSSNVEESGQSNIPLSDTETNKTDQMTPVDSERFTLPVYEFWYMHHAYRKELEQFEKQHGVSVCPEVSISIRHVQSSSHDSVSKTSEEFLKLIQGCVGSFSQAVISHDMDSDVVKDTLCTIKSEEAKMMFTMTASNCLLFGPKKYTDMIKKETTRVEQQFKHKLLKNVFDDKKTRQNKLDQMPDYGAEQALGDSKGSSEQDSKDAPAEEETCAICMDSFTDKKRLKCGHEFCRDCLKISVESLGSICPVCKEVFGKLEGNQPEGTMRVSKTRFRFPGYPNCGSTEVYYDIPSGIQNPNPGKPYYGTTRQAYLPAPVEEETCPICMDSFTDKKRLKCGHEFCRDCLKQSVESLGSICPVCKEVFGKLEGNQPEGTMRVSKTRLCLPGYPHCGSIEICYDIPSGIQTDKHPNPGKPYYGTTRQAYLPDNPEGNEVLALLRRAFQQKLIFTVGTSTTTGRDNVVTWNDIYHKTSIYGGPQSYGYPDPDYLKRVKDELKAKGIE